MRFIALRELPAAGLSLIVFLIDFQTLMPPQCFDESVVRSRFDSELYLGIADAQETRIASL